jgi:hypothetical protein
MPWVGFEPMIPAFEQAKKVHASDRAATVTCSRQSYETNKNNICAKSKAVSLFLCLTNQSLRHEDVWGSECIDPRILDLGTSWTRVVSFTPRPLYPQGKSPRHPLNRRRNGPQRRSGRCRDEKDLAPTGIQTLSSCPACSQSLYQ